ncbi:MAG: M23 family metallopeptidase [Tissierellales bacterium]|nr:M23 family metallopeptidase [Tissierellales bacterium]MBN2826677.1 M23 family metallopeptidase [Tissierellales bacterium]
MKKLFIFYWGKRNNILQAVLMTSTGKPFRICMKLKYLAFAAVSLIMAIVVFTSVFLNNQHLNLVVSERDALILSLQMTNQAKEEAIASLNKTLEDKDQIIASNNAVILAQNIKIDQKIQEFDEFKKQIIDLTGIGMGGSEIASENSPVSPDNSFDTSLNELDSRLRETTCIIDDVAEKMNYIDSFPDLYPTSGMISSGFGYRINPFSSLKEYHNGVDIANASGTSIFAAGSGKIIDTGYNYSYGKYVLINHGYGYKTLYAHLSKISVKINQVVCKGDLIATMGSTGQSTGPHLHFEIIKDGSPIDPVKIKDYFE